MICKHRLFEENPGLLSMFPTLQAQFPDGHIDDKAKFRSNEAIRRHGCAVLFLIDRMISEFDNMDSVRAFIQKAAQKHTHLKVLDMKGEEFLVFVLIFLKGVNKRYM